MENEEFFEAFIDGFMEAVYQVSLDVHLLNKAVARTWLDLCEVWADSKGENKRRPTIVDAWNATPETDRPKVT